jgi:hypothetical protein
MGRSYNPTRVIKSSGVHTFYIGRPEDPISQAFEAYCIHTEQTFSETCRDMIVTALVHFGLIEDPGIDEGRFLDVGEGILTPKFYAFRKQAEHSRQAQLRRLATEGRKAKEEKEEKVAKAETAFD